ncbi:MAG TPA: valine--tRNA ligase [Candidatus Solibacter sp.]|nr:valine--tRNA ligase [Candidatus Solibacter sp.]
MPREIAKAYEPQRIEPHWAQYWVKEQLFKADVNAPGPVFSIVIPPPNVTGSLHIGHMLEHTEIDILARWHRMRGYNTLFLPGTDHAGISTQRVVVKQLMDQGIDYHQLGREGFEKRVWEWKAKAGGQITEQMRGIGESCDWSREKFTLSPEMSRVVRKVFVQLYKEGLIYRETRLVNWCPVCLTVLSDLEVVHEERQGSLWHIRYPVQNSKEFIVVATTRPETMLGDTAVAVHPEDERYAHLVGKSVMLPLMDREIPVIADAMVDQEFGTGAVKITPAHDPNDFEVGKRHKLAEIDVMTDDGRMSTAAGVYAGLDRFEARKKIVEDLKAADLLEKVTGHTNSIGICERSKTVVEPRISTQWFCAMKGLAAPALKAVREHEVGKENTIQIVPDNRRQEFLNWLDNIRDWTISRQLWWGHRIPAWYCGDCAEIIVAEEAPSKCGKCRSEKLTQDPDVLDTWFSSGLWPFSTLGWPEKTADFEKYYPTTLMITGYDILFFWVARMTMLGIHFTGKVPFHTVYLHSLVRTGSGEKMSKSKGTGLDPVELNQQYGTDAMRFCLASMAAPGTDIVLSDDRLAGARNFANKIWNAARFLFMNLEKFETGGTGLEELASPEVRAGAPYAFAGSVPLVDQWLYSRLAITIETVNEALKNYRFHEAAQNVYQFFWDDFCDWYIEWIKPELQNANRERAVVAWKNLFAAFNDALLLLHPFMPFLTEELWHQLPQPAGAKSIALSGFPEPKERWKNEEGSKKMQFLQQLIRFSRYTRSQKNVPNKTRFPLALGNLADSYRELVQDNEEAVIRLGLFSSVNYALLTIDAKTGAVHSTPHGDVSMSIDTHADVSAELLRIGKEIERLEKDVASKERQLGDEVFRSRAPQKIIAGLEATLADRQIELIKLRDRLKQISGNS